VAYLNQNVPEYILPENWPPNSPDLNPVDFSIWGYLIIYLQNIFNIISILYVIYIVIELEKTKRDVFVKTYK
jgi:hypothetical protein